MHRSLATTCPLGPDNSGDIELSFPKAQVYAPHCRDTLKIKALQKAQLKIPVGKCELWQSVWAWIQNPCSSRVQQGQRWRQSTAVQPGYAHTIPSPEGDVVANNWCIMIHVLNLTYCNRSKSWIIWAATSENRSSGIPTRSHTNRAVQPQKMARDLNFCI